MEMLEMVEAEEIEPLGCACQCTCWCWPWEPDPKNTQSVNEGAAFKQEVLEST